MPRRGKAGFRRVGGYAAAAILGSAPSVSPALEWTTLPVVSLGTRQDDNYRLLIDDQRRVTRRQLETRASITAVDDTFEFRVIPRLMTLEFDDPRELDRNDEYLDLGVVAQDIHNRWTFDAGYANEGTLTSEFQETGYTEADIDSMTTRLAVGWVATPGERGQYTVSYATRGVNYEKLFGSPLVDYRYSSFELGYVRATSQSASVALSGFDNKLDSESLTGTTRTSGFSAAWIKRLSQTLETRIGTGLYRVRSQIPVEPYKLRADLEPSLDLSITKIGSAWTFGANASVDSQPSAYGVMYRHETLQVDCSWHLSSALTLTIWAERADVAAEEEVYSSRDRRYGQGGISVNWQVAERMALQFGVDTRAQEYLTSPRARAEAVFMSFVYRGTGVRT